MSSTDHPPPDPTADNSQDPIRLVCSTTMFEVIGQAVLELWNTVNLLTSIEAPKHQRYRVTIFGSARLQPGMPVYEGVRYLASELTRMGCDIVTGGGPGLMQAANEGSVATDPTNQMQSIGIRVDLGFEQSANPFVEQVYHHRTFFSRLHHFVIASDAFVVVPGGIGTLLEAVMVWQLLQVRHLQNTPLIMVGPMWRDLIDWAKQHMVQADPPMAAPDDLMIPHYVEAFDEAIALLRQSQLAWQNHL